MAMNEIVVPKNLVFDFVQCVTKKKEPVVDIWHFPPPPLQLPAAPPPDLIFLVKENIFQFFQVCLLLVAHLFFFHGLLTAKLLPSAATFIFESVGFC